MTELAIMLH